MVTSQTAGPFHNCLLFRPPIFVTTNALHGLPHILAGIVAYRSCERWPDKGGSMMKKYVVEQGDTMWSIAEAMGIRPKLLMASNPQVKNPNQLRPGSVIVIPELTKSQSVGNVPTGTNVTPASQAPTTESNPPMETVPAAGAAQAGAGFPGTGTTPASPLAKVKTASAKTASTQSGNAKTAGMPPFFGFVWPHAVQPGESWSSIQQRYNIPMQHLLQMNPGLSNRALRPGDLIYVPGMVPPSQLPAWAGQLQGVGNQGFSGMPGGAGSGMPGMPGSAGSGMPGMPGSAGSGMPGMPGSGSSGMPGMPGMPGMGVADTAGSMSGGAGNLASSVGGASSPWDEPYGPHQHNPFREEHDYPYSAAWTENFLQGDSDGSGEEWRAPSDMASGPYYKFQVPDKHSSELSVYLGDPDEDKPETNS
jgi:LysM repeat protein